MKPFLSFFSSQKALFVLLFTFLFIQVHTQIPNDTWRDHLSFIKGKKLAISPTKVYYAAGESGLYSFDKSSGEVEKLTTVTGLSDIDISTIYYSQEKNELLICYVSGDIDILSKNGILNIPDIKNKAFFSSKEINKIESHGEYVYLGCDFGIVLFDLVKNEIKETYFFGSGGGFIKVNDIIIKDNKLYAATASGIYEASLSDENLLDYANWNHLSYLPQDTGEYKFIELFNDKILAAYYNPLAGRDELIELNDNSWSDFGYSEDTTILSLTAYNDLLSISGNFKISFYNSSKSMVSSFQIHNCQEGLKDNDGSYYFAAWGEGFIKGNTDADLSYIRLNSPMFNTVGQVFTDKDQVWVGSGGYFNPWYEGGVYNFSDNRWESLNQGYFAGFNDIGNIYKVAIAPTDPRHVFATSYLKGLYEIQFSESTKQYSNTKTYSLDNSPVFKLATDSTTGIRLGGIDFDSKGNLWMVMDLATQPLFVLRANGDLEHIELSLNTAVYRDVLVTEDDQIWILSRNNGMIVLKEQEDGTISKKTFALKNQQNDLINAGYCLSEDKDGDIWVGTSKGPLVYYSNPEIFDEDSEIKGHQIAIPRNDGTEYADFLLDYVIITDIAVDGGNRKWIATENSGVYLVSHDGQKTIHHFTEENSPLFSNNILGIGIQQSTGEVFISTNRGLISYMGNSTEGLTDYTDVYVYPNPVRPDFEGDITITGLIENSNVKITDVSGNLVYETTSQGGKAVWNGRNFDGERVHTGVYLVFLANKDGSKTHITKLLFIH